MRSTYKVRESELSYFVTSTIVNWIPVFNIQQNVDILIEALIYSQKNKGLKIYKYMLYISQRMNNLGQGKRKNGNDATSFRLEKRGYGKRVKG